MNKSEKTKHGIWRGKVLPRLLLTVAPLPKNTFCSIDVTNKCNLRCKHCYFYSYDQEKGPELSIEAWLLKIETMQRGKDKFYSCTWVGGEPMLRRELVEKGRRFFRSNRVVTNGTLPLPDWPDVEFHVSIDGTRDLHDAIRGNGCHERIKKNISDARTADLNIAIACCLNRSNINCAPELIEEWRMVPHIRHILFDFFTPIKGVKEDLWLTFEERNRAIEMLESLKSKYGDFIGGPQKTFWLMREENRHRAVGTNCVFVRHGTAFDSWGNIKKPCVIGPKADCDRCGCIVPFSVKAWKMPSNLLREAWKEIRSKSQIPTTKSQSTEQIPTKKLG